MEEGIERVDTCRRPPYIGPVPCSPRRPPLFPHPDRPTKEIGLDGSTYELLSLFNDGGLMMYPPGSLLPPGSRGHQSPRPGPSGWPTRTPTRSSKRLDGLPASGDIDGAIDVAVVHSWPHRRHPSGGASPHPGSEGAGRGGGSRWSPPREPSSWASWSGVWWFWPPWPMLPPLMGFLGTVAGMILAFAAIEAAGDVDPTLVAGGDQGGAPHHRSWAGHRDSR